MLHRRWRVGIKIHTVKRIWTKTVPPHSNVGRGVGRNYVSIHLYFGGGDGGGGGRGVTYPFYFYPTLLILLTSIIAFPEIFQLLYALWLSYSWIQEKNWIFICNRLKTNNPNIKNGIIKCMHNPPDGKKRNAINFTLSTYMWQNMHLQ